MEAASIVLTEFSYRRDQSDVSISLANVRFFQLLAREGLLDLRGFAFAFAFAFALAKTLLFLFATDFFFGRVVVIHSSFWPSGITADRSIHSLAS